MSTQDISLDEQAEAFKAWKRGEIIEYWNYNDERWSWLSLASGKELIPDNIIRRKPAPKLRPWKPEEVPLGARCRAIGKPMPTYLITGFGSAGEIYCGIKTYYADDLIRAEYSTDNGTTWKPCGVEETT